ncbi:MAG: disulfide bond formation protein B [Pseudomonadales bacterium]|nr:disulfide bond formation protein B [Pseudomonadales bacterium]
MSIPNSRILFTLVFLGTVFLMSVALYMQHVMGLEPCSMCILQRIMVISVGLIALAGAIHNPAEKGIRIYGALVSTGSVIGAGISIRHLWLQSLPPDQVPACGPSLDYLLDVFPLTEVLMMVLKGDGACAEVLWTFLGISIPCWVLIGFIGLFAFVAFQMWRPVPGGK